MKENTFNEFHETTSQLLSLLNSLSEEQLNIQPKEGWSAGQFGGHLLKSYAFIETVKGKTKKTERPIDQKLERIKILFSDTSIKMDAPKAILPSKERTVKKDLIKGLEDRIEQIKKVIQTKDLALTCIDFSIAEYGEFTRYEWIWFNIYHTKRHIHQLENMIASNNIKMI